MIRRYRWWLSAGALLLAVIVGGVFVLVLGDGERPPDGDRPGPPGTGPLTIVSMGDSTLSGEGAGDYTAETNGRGGNWCHRSPRATVKQTDLPKVRAEINLACSGAPSEQVALGEVEQYTEPSQAQQLAKLIKNDHRVVAIVVAVGANDDPKFSHMMNRCFEAWLVPSQPPCSDYLSTVFQDRVDAMIPQVVDALNDIQLVLKRAGYKDSDTDIVLQSYASPVSPDIPESLRNLNGCPFHKQDLRWVKFEAVRALSDGLRTAAAKAGVRFLDLSRAGNGHEACTGGADPSSEWFRRLTVQWSDLTEVDRAPHAIQESFHPNARGYAQFGRCLTEFFAMREEETGACVVGKDGNLHAVTSLPQI